MQTLKLVIRFNVWAQSFQCDYHDREGLGNCYLASSNGYCIHIPTFNCTSFLTLPRTLCLRQPRWSSVEYQMSRALRSTCPTSTTSLLISQSWEYPTAARLAGMESRNKCGLQLPWGYSCYYAPTHKGSAFLCPPNSLPPIAAAALKWASGDDHCDLLKTTGQTLVLVLVIAEKFYDPVVELSLLLSSSPAELSQHNYLSNSEYHYMMCVDEITVVRHSA